ncbi:MAG: hypothetical protein ACR2KK_07450 [Acidimicrobiales bacterium]
MEEIADIGAGAGLLGRYLKLDFPSAQYRFEEPLESLEKMLEGTHGRDANLRGRAGIPSPVVTLLDVLEHQEDDRAFLASLLDRMVVGARLVVTVPALNALWSAWDTELGHHRRYDKSSLRRVFDGLPVRLDEVSYLFPELVPPALVRRALKRAGSTEFPVVSRPLNQALYALGVGTLRMRHLSPFGSSLFAVATRLDSATAGC